MYFTQLINAIASELTLPTIRTRQCRVLTILFRCGESEKSWIYRRDDDGGLGVGALGRVRIGIGGGGVGGFAPVRVVNHQIPLPTIAIVIIRDKITTGA